MNAFGTPNQVSALDLCGWGRGFATRFVYGVASVGTGSGGGAMPDIANAGCLILWGYNPSASRLPHATATVAAMKRGVRLVIILYALTGSFDACGGNVLLPSVPSGAINGDDLPSAKKMAPAIGLEERPLGPARYKYVSAHDFYTAVLEGKPYPVRALIGFGTNLLLAHADPERGRKALAALDFYAHADLFMTPTAEMADIVLPIASAFEREALKIGFEISAEAQSLVQLRTVDARRRDPVGGPPTHRGNVCEVEPESAS
jgi:anaerobic selenocysteine-containing dehydrogenase